MENQNEDKMKNGLENEEPLFDTDLSFFEDTEKSDVFGAHGFTKDEYAACLKVNALHY